LFGEDGRVAKYFGHLSDVNSCDAASTDPAHPHATQQVSTTGDAKAETRTKERLSPRECSVLALIAKGQSNKRVPQTLKITPETVKPHLKRAFVKLGSCSRAEAVARATELGLLTHAPLQPDSHGAASGRISAFTPNVGARSQEAVAVA